MRILVLHNRYQQPGGEDTVVACERQLLAERGHDIRLYSVCNDELKNRLDVARAAWQVAYSPPARRRIARLIDEFLPDVVHVHNFFPLLSPSIYDACWARGMPVVQTLHNYRLLCVNGLLLRRGRVCEDCIGKTLPWPGVLHGCYRGSRAASGAVAGMLLVHRLLRTWSRKVDLYIALTDFCRQKFIDGGLPPGKIVVKPNFVHPDPGMGQGPGAYALFVGRLSAEKGVARLLQAWQQLGKIVPLKIVGDGPLAPTGFAASGATSGVEWLGRQSRDRVLTLMKGARFLVFPSVYYEGFPAVIAEAYSTGLPIVASNLGSTASLIVPGRTGLLFSPDDPADLAAKASWLWTHRRERDEMSHAARREFEQKYAAARNYQMLIDIYMRAASAAGIGRGAGVPTKYRTTASSELAVRTRGHAS